MIEHEIIYSYDEAKKKRGGGDVTPGGICRICSGNFRAKNNGNIPEHFSLLFGLKTKKNILSIFHHFLRPL